MNAITYHAMPTDHAEALWAGGVDANGQVPERAVSDGDGVPCRHCLRDVAAGEAYLILSYRPFPSPQPYAETGPIFLHATPCQRAGEAHEIPAMLARRKAHLIKGYSANHRIIYGTGQIVEAARLDAAAQATLQRPDVAYVHVRSAVNNCYTCRIDRSA